MREIAVAMMVLAVCSLSAFWSCGSNFSFVFLCPRHNFWYVLRHCYTPIINQTWHVHSRAWSRGAMPRGVPLLGRMAVVFLASLELPLCYSKPDNHEADARLLLTEKHADFLVRTLKVSNNLVCQCLPVQIHVRLECLHALSLGAPRLLEVQSKQGGSSWRAWVKHVEMLR